MKSVIETNRYSTHNYYGRKYWCEIKNQILANTNECDLVLDPFMGSGTTIVESLINNRNAIGIDINPISLFIVENTIKIIDVKEIIENFETIKKEIKDEVSKIYFLNNTCFKCNKKLLFNSFNSKDNITRAFCEKCNLNIKLVGAPIYAFDFKKDVWTPSDDFFYNGKTKIYLKDYFSERNLNCLGIIMAQINKIKNYDLKNFFLFCFSSNLSKSTLLNSPKEKKGWRKLDPNNFIVPENYIEFNVWNGFVNKVISGINLKIETNKLLFNKTSRVNLFLSNSTKLNLLNESVDFILTDPPYYSEINYSKIYFPNLCWLKLNSDFQSLELIEKKSDFEAYLLVAFKEMYRVLKTNKNMVLLLSNIKKDQSKKMCELVEQAGFKLIQKEFDSKYDRHNYFVAQFKKVLL